MNPVARFSIDNYKEILREIEQQGDLTYLRLLEDRVIQEIVTLIQQETDEAKAELAKIEKLIEEDLGFIPRSQLLISALKNSIKGALAAAKIYLV